MIPDAAPPGACDRGVTCTTVHAMRLGGVMNGAGSVDEVKRDVASLAERVARIEQQLALTGQQQGAGAPGQPSAWRPPAGPHTVAAPQLPGAPARRRTPRIEVTPSRLLALAGGVVLLLGTGFLLRYAVAQGWLGPEVRVVLALLGSGGLALAGQRLERTEATRAVGQICIATGAAGAYTAIVAAAAGYEIVPYAVGLASATAVAAAATLKGVRSRMQAVAGLGVGGALLAPLLLQTPPGMAGLSFLAVTITAGLVVAARRRWIAVAGLTFALGWPQVWALSAPDVSLVGALPVAATVGVLFLSAAVVLGWRQSWGRAAAPAVLTALNAMAAAGLGGLLLQETVPAFRHGPGLWVAAIAVVHLAGGAVVSRRLADPPIGTVLLVTGVLMADAAVLLLFDGLAIMAGLSLVALAAAVAVALASWLRSGVRIALIVQLAVVVLHATEVGVHLPGAGSTTALWLMAALSGAAVGLGLLLRPAARDLALGAAISYLGLALLRLVTVEAPLDALLNGTAHLGPAVAMCAMAVVGAVILSQVLDRRFTAAAVVVANYGVSLAAVSMDPDGVGRVALTGLWAIAGGGAFVAGRHLQRVDVRRGGAALLAAAVAKAAFVDTTTLDGTNRAVALLLCGAVLVATAVSEARANPPDEASQSVP